jgi:hypothetical protein
MKTPLLRLLSFIAPFAAASAGAQSTPEEGFWNWFQQNESALFNFENDQDRTFDRLGAEMHRIDPNLTFEFGPKEHGVREFVISADGIRSAFPTVEKLYSAAPRLPRWTFIKFRPRRPPSDIKYNNVIVQAKAVVADVRLAREKADIDVFVPGYADDPKRTYTAIAYLLLDQALGEYDVETRVGQIAVKPIGQAPVGARSLGELPAMFDELFHRR